MVAAVVNLATNDRRPVNKATAYLRTLSIAELRESRRGSGRGWTWSGGAADATTATEINQEPIFGCRE